LYRSSSFDRPRDQETISLPKYNLSIIENLSTTSLPWIRLAWTTWGYNSLLTAHSERRGKRGEREAVGETTTTNLEICASDILRPFNN
jgi:hypothetical protein